MTDVTTLHPDDDVALALRDLRRTFHGIRRPDGCAATRSWAP